MQEARGGCWEEALTKSFSKAFSGDDIDNQNTSFTLCSDDDLGI